MKKILAGLLLITIILIAGATIAPSFIDWNAYKSQAAQEVKKHTDLDMVMNGDLNFSIFPTPRFVAEAVSIKAPIQKKYNEIVSFDRLEVTVKLAPLLKGQINIASITITRPNISIEKLEDGTINAQTEKLSKKSEAKVEATPPPALDIALDNITIKDATFLFFDHATKTETRLQNINADLAAKTLQGPFEAQGSLFISGNSINFDIKTDAYDANTGLITPNVKLTLQPSGLSAQYNGVISTGDELSLQGQTEVSVTDLSTLIPGAQKGNSFSMKGLLTANANQASFKNLKIMLDDQEIMGAFKTQISPLEYSISLKSADPLNLRSVLGDASPYKIAAFDVAIKGNEEKFEFSAPSLKLDGSIFKMNGNVSALNQKRTSVSTNISVDTLNLDDLMPAQQSNSADSSKTSPKEALKRLILPFDLNLKFDAATLLFDKKQVKGLQLDAVFTENAVTLKNLSIEDAIGTKLKMNSEIKALNGEPQISTYIDLTSQDIKAALTALDIDAQSLPSNLSTLSVKTKLDGVLDTLNITSNIKALGAEIIAKGKVMNATQKAALENLILQIKHNSMAKALENISGISISDKNLQSSVDFYAKINQKDQTYTLSEIKGDLSGISVTGNLKLNIGGKVPNIKGDLEFGKLTLTALAEKKQASSSERWSKEPIDVSGLHAANADINLKAASINYGGWPLEKPSLQIKLRDGNLDITDLKAQIFGGTISSTIKAQTNEQPRQPIYFESASSFSNVDIGKLAKSLIGTQIVKLSGAGDVTMNIKSSGASIAALIYDLSGDGKVDGKNIMLQGVDVTKFVRALSDNSKPGDTLTGIWKGTTGGGNTQFDTLDGGFVIKEGVVFLNAINLYGKQAQIETNGTLSLPKWTLDTKHKLIVKGTDETPSDVPPFEISFKGSLDNPTQTFGQGLLNDYLNRKIQRKFNKILSEKLGVPMPSNDNVQNASPDQNKEEQKPKSVEDAAEEAIKGVLKGLLR